MARLFSEENNRVELVNVKIVSDKEAIAGLFYIDSNFPLCCTLVTDVDTGIDYWIEVPQPFGNAPEYYVTFNLRLTCKKHEKTSIQS